ncbi:FK506-binding protein 4-like [Ananas comosus]|uniref:FK506-binding protein 4-like n=1 Tax=Ananas comosus TaxID=4615 RepID=A0A6P5FB48_ANACO|nr:FK506-binding protein 4-like [Ananas comosus]
MTSAPAEDECGRSAGASALVGRQQEAAATVVYDALAAPRRVEHEPSPADRKLRRWGRRRWICTAGQSEPVLTLAVGGRRRRRRVERLSPHKAQPDSISMSSRHEKSSTENSSDEESDEDDMVTAYQQLVVESKKVAKHNKKLRRSLHDLEQENSRMASLSKDLEQERDGLTKAYNSLFEKCTLLEKENESHTYIDQAMKKDDEHSTKVVPKLYGHVKRVCKQKAKSPTTPLDRKAQWKSKKDDPKNKQTWKPKKEDPKTNAKQTWKRKKDDPKKKIAQIVDKQHISQSSRPTQPKTRKV